MGNGNSSLLVAARVSQTTVTVLRVLGSSTKSTASIPRQFVDAMAMALGPLTRQDLGLRQTRLPFQLHGRRGPVTANHLSTKVLQLFRPDTRGQYNENSSKRDF
jgi:hypothetical protein